MGTEDPKPGDMIEISRCIYQHWAVYVGDGYVVHMTALDGSLLKLMPGWYGMCQIKKELLKDVVNKHKWKINNDMDKMYKPRETEDIVEVALSWVGKEVWYNVFTWNCEDFASMLRYDKPKSLQVFKVVGVAGVLVVGVIGGILAVQSFSAFKSILIAILKKVGAGKMVCSTGATNLLIRMN